MINFIISENFYSLFAGIGLMAAFLMTCVCITKLTICFREDAGRDFAHAGKLSAGKPRGAGIIFILVFAAAALLFSRAFFGDRDLHCSSERRDAHRIFG